MKNTPQKIYLQVGCSDDECSDFTELSRNDITWCEDKINDTDICYVRAGVKTCTCISNSCHNTCRENGIVTSARLSFIVEKDCPIHGHIIGSK